MERRTPLAGCTIVCALMLLLFGTPAHPLVFMVGGPGGVAEEPSLECEDPPADDPDSDGADDGGGNNGNGGDDEECSSMEDWNPTVHCPVSDGDNVDDLLDCLLDEIVNPPPACPPITTSGSGGSGAQDLMQNPPHEDDCIDPMEREDFTVTRLPEPYFGLEILKLDGSEIERFTFRENFPGLQTVSLQTRLLDRVARIGEFQERPGLTGSVYVTLNNRTVRIKTSFFPTPPEMTGELIRLVRDAGFTVEYFDSYVYVIQDDWKNSGINYIEFRSTDRDVARSDVSLLPRNAPELDPLGLLPF